MRIFDFFREEEDLTLTKLKDLVSSFRNETREEVFDNVKLILDLLKGHCDKQKAMLIDKIAEFPSDSNKYLENTIKARDHLIAEIGDLVMVHVDEPGYKEYLSNLLKLTETYFSLSKNLYQTLEKSLAPEVIKQLDDNLTTAVHSEVGFNSLQESTP